MALRFDTPVPNWRSVAFLDVLRPDGGKARWCSSCGKTGGAQQATTADVADRFPVHGVCASSFPVRSVATAHAVCQQVKGRGVVLRGRLPLPEARVDAE